MSDQLVHHAPCPVTVVRSGATGRGQRPRDQAWPLPREAPAAGGGFAGVTLVAGRRDRAGGRARRPRRPGVRRARRRPDRPRRRSGRAGRDRGADAGSATGPGVPRPRRAAGLRLRRRPARGHPRRRARCARSTDRVDGRRLLASTTPRSPPTGRSTSPTPRPGSASRSGATDLIRRTASGRLLRRAPDGTVTELLGGLEFANGVALAADGSYVAVAETGACRVHRVWLTGGAGRGAARSSSTASTAIRTTSPWAPTAWSGWRCRARGRRC